MPLDHRPTPSRTSRHPTTERFLHPAFADTAEEEDEDPPTLAARTGEDTAAAAASHGAPLLQIRHGPGTGAVFPIAPGTTRIGRGRDCDLVLDHPTVSTHHAGLHRTGGQLWLTDADSLNGTYRNRHLLDTDTVLDDGDEISIGVFALTFHAHSHTATGDRPDRCGKEEMSR